MNEDEIVINTKILIKTGLSIEQYLILECTNKGFQKTLEDYATKLGSINKSVFIDLSTKGYIENIEGDIKFEKLKLTEKFYKDFSYVKLDHNKYFKELREVYPKKVGSRSLHQDLPGCKKKYKNIIDSEETHKTILKCIELYLLELKNDNRMQYIQLLSTWLNQRNFEQYYEEALKLDKIENKQDTYNSV